MVVFFFGSAWISLDACLQKRKRKKGLFVGVSSNIHPKKKKARNNRKKEEKEKNYERVCHTWPER